MVGIVTNRDLRFETRLDQPVKAIMTPQEKLVTVREGATRQEAMQLLHRHRLERVLVVGDKFQLKGLVTVQDILKESEHPNAPRTRMGKLRVGAAVGVGEGTEERVAALVEAGADVLVVDTAHVPGRARPRRLDQEELSRSRSSAATSEPATARERSSTTAPTASRSASARARSAPRASSPASACRRSPRSRTSPRRSRTCR